jgi:hypothetical protein
VPEGSFRVPEGSRVPGGKHLDLGVVGTGLEKLLEQLRGVLGRPGDSQRREQTDSRFQMISPAIKCLTERGGRFFRLAQPHEGFANGIPRPEVARIDDSGSLQVLDPLGFFTSTEIDRRQNLDRHCLDGVQ